SNFGAYDNSPLARVQSTGCHSSLWVSSSTVLCKVPIGFDISAGAIIRSGTSEGSLARGSVKK
ncbi:hypothetical protein T484DRAFT_1812300, partial [Baffinella frigidus]